MVEIKGLKVGPGTNPDIFMGPLINSRLLDRSLSHIHDAVENGAQLVVGGERLSGPAFDGGYFLAPALLTDTDHTMLVMTEETFGPVLGIMRMKSPEEAIHYANDTPYGLAAFVFTRDLARAMRLSQRLEAGNVWINKIRRTYDEVPFGGYKESGLGREKSHYGLEEYLELKAIYVSY